MISAPVWPTRRLGSVAHFYGGSSLPEGEPFHSQKNGYLLMRVSDLNLPGNEVFIKEAKLWTASAGSRSATCPPGSLLIPKRGGAIGTNKKRITTRPCVLDPNLMAISPSTELDTRFLYHWFLTFDLTSITSGSSVPQLNKRDLDPLLLPLPPIDVQRHLVAKLDAAAALCAKRRQALAQLDALTQSIFLDMLGPRQAATNEWPTARLGDLGAIQGGLQVISTRSSLPIEVPYLRVANVYRGRLDLHEIKTIHVTAAELARTRLQAGDLLVVEGHGNAAEIGRCALWSGSIDPCTHQNHLIRVRVDEHQLDPVFAEHHLNSPFGRQDLLRSANTTSGLNTISVRDVADVRMVIPPLPLQERFSRIAKTVKAQRNFFERALVAHEMLLASLQDRAFQGKL